jgi:omega-amidase
MEYLKVALIQTHLYWEDPDKNIQHFDALLSNLEQVDLVVLPEMFSTGFTMKPELLGEDENGKSLQWMRNTAKQLNTAILGSISSKAEDNFYYNRCYFVFPDGTYKFYNKRHLFRVGQEQLHYKSGNEKVIVEYKDWKILLQICYDLRFPVFSRNLFDKETASWSYDLAVYPANWPEVRRYMWSNLLVARAIENQAYVIGVNRIGEDGNKVNHSGDSVILNYLGEPLQQCFPNENIIVYSELNKKKQAEFRTKFPVGLDADDFDINNEIEKKL